MTNREKYIPPKNVLKICILGEGGTGKTTLTQRIITGSFNDKTKMTIGVDFHLLKTSIFDPTVPEDEEESPQIDIQAQMWDFAGESRFRFILPRYCKGAVGGLLCFDLTRYSTTKYLNEWFEIWRTNAPKNAPLILIGTKADLLEAPEDLRIAEETIKELAEKLEIDKYYIISAKTGKDIHIMTNVLLNRSYIYHQEYREKKVNGELVEDDSDITAHPAKIPSDEENEDEVDEDEENGDEVDEDE